MKQSSLFPEAAAAKAAPSMPPGFRYHPDFITAQEEQAIAEALGKLPFKPFDFHGYQGNRRTVSFGLRYDYDRSGVAAAAPPPDFLEKLRAKAAAFAGCAPEDLRQVGINEYRPGAGIGWHRDKPQFGDVVGVSLLSPVKMRFRKPQGEGWLRASKILDPRSIYIMTGESRRAWYHSTPPVTSLRYSIMFRTLAGPLTLLEDSQQAQEE
jgi:alkylated DNA repair dioxygenase AlkB